MSVLFQVLKLLSLKVFKKLIKKKLNIFFIIIFLNIHVYVFKKKIILSLFSKLKYFSLHRFFSFQIWNVIS